MSLLVANKSPSCTGFFIFGRCPDAQHRDDLRLVPKSPTIVSQ